MAGGGFFHEARRALGVQIHDSCHAGQIALLRGMQGLPPVQ